MADGRSLGRYGVLHQRFDQPGANVDVGEGELRRRVASVRHENSFMRSVILPTLHGHLPLANQPPGRQNRTFNMMAAYMAAD
jgi:hypothetical protein